MPSLAIRFDLRAPPFGADPERLYREALEMAAWADGARFDLVRISEHHGADDGYCPAPLVFAAAVAARTKRVRIRMSALLLPLHDPVRVAEDVAVADLVSGGRTELLVGAGYRPSEFAMFGRAPTDRAALLEEGLDVLLRAWTGEPFDHRGTTVRVMPRPVQRPHPPVILGGSSAAAARRAARMGFDFLPTQPSLYEIYREECAGQGRPTKPLPVQGPPFVFVAEDPERAWATLLPHIRHEVDSYGVWAAEAGMPPPVENSDDEELRRGGSYRVITPEDCLSLVRALGDDGVFLLHPLVSGLDPDVAWSSLDLIGSLVLPELGAGRPGPMGRPG